MSTIQVIPAFEFSRVRAAAPSEHEGLALIAAMCRYNCLSAVKNAGSGHLGSSFSAMDILVWLYFHRMNTLSIGFDSPDRDIFFSSKGHDVPAQYAVLHAAGVIGTAQLGKLRRLGGLDGHPDVHIRGIEANSGSLGMGLSKAKGYAWAKRALGRPGHVYVLLGDGELQEGQNYEALLTAAAHGVAGFTVIVDHNKYQTDMAVDSVTSLGDLEAKFRAFGWDVGRCDGHSFAALHEALSRPQTGSPQIVIADTVKGAGISFMESSSQPGATRGFYKWHSGAPDDESFSRGSAELFDRISTGYESFGLGLPALEAIGETLEPSRTGDPKVFIADAFGEALVDIGTRRPDLVVLDGDLATDCRVREFSERFPARFIENGIAEQDMVSMAGGIARMGMLPVVNSFASFLASRANEQIYNNATERTKIIYVCHFGGLIPAGPGKSHQSIRDIALFNALPNATVLVPANPMEAKMALQYLVDHAPEVAMLRLSIGPMPRNIELPPDYVLSPGRGAVIREGADAILFAYGPVMLHEALVASELLSQAGFGLAVVSHPWMSVVDAEWLTSVVASRSSIFVLEDHGPTGALGDQLLTALEASHLLEGRRFQRFAVHGFPACGSPLEVLRHHRLDGASLANTILGQPVSPRASNDHLYTLEAPQ